MQDSSTENTKSYFCKKKKVDLKTMIFLPIDSAIVTGCTVDTKCVWSNKLKLDAREIPTFPQSNLEFEATFQGRLKQVTIFCFVI